MDGVPISMGCDDDLLLCWPRLSFQCVIDQEYKTQELSTPLYKGQNAILSRWPIVGGISLYTHSYTKIELV